ncbi:MAG: glycosyltransferase family 39 protein [Chloroflexi bacterium]|nr:glycosyltransferase family 39 protein [Chloroflexota bacterium]
MRKFLADGPSRAAVSDTHGSAAGGSIWFGAMLSAMVVVGFAIRLHGLDTLSLWLDEAFSFHIATQPGLLALLNQVAIEDNHPPFYYVLLSGWLPVVGDSEFALRFVSVAAGTLSIPLIARLGASIFDRRVGLMAAALLAISPLSIWYSREARMYALVCLLAIASVVLFVRCQECWSVRTAVAYVVVSLLMLLTHYYGFFIFLFENIAFAVFPRRELGARRWIALQAAIAALFSPWLLAVTQQFQRSPHDYSLPISVLEVARKLNLTFSMGDALAPTVYLGQIGAGPAISLEPAQWGFLAVIVVGALWGAITAVVGARRGEGAETAPLRGWLGTRLRGEGAETAPLRRWLSARLRGEGGDTGESASHGRLPQAALPAQGVFLCLLYLVIAPVSSYLITIALSTNIRASERMYYIVVLPAYLLLLAFGVARLALAARMLGVLTLLFVFGTSAVVSADQSVSRGKEDFRSITSYIAERESTEETIVLNAEHIYPAFEYYYKGRLRWQRAEVGDEVATPAFLERVTHQKEGAWLVLSREELVDPQTIVRRWFDDHGLLLDERWYPGGRIRYYFLEPRPNYRAPDVPNKLQALFGGKIALTGYALPQTARTASQMKVRLYWHSLAKAPEDYRLVTYLQDGSGRIWSQIDRYPLIPHYATSRWSPGEYLTDSYLLPIPLGTPPGTYEVRVRLYSPESGNTIRPDGTGQEEVQIGRVVVLRAALGEIARTLKALPARSTYALNDDLSLLEWASSRTEAQAGEAVDVSLLWQARRRPVDRYDVVFQLLDASGAAVLETRRPVGATGYRTDAWDAGEVIKDYQSLLLSNQLPAGAYHLRARLASSTGDLSKTSVDLGAIRVSHPERSFASPMPEHPYEVDLGRTIVFLGYDVWPVRIAPGTKLRLSTYWRAWEQMNQSYTLFVHLLGEGNIVVAQQDDVPLKGTRPTTGWAVGETVRDEHELQIPPDAAPGDYRLEMGFYDPRTGERLAVLDTGPRASENAILVREPIIVVPPE